MAGANTVTDVLNRGLIAGTLGAPADMANLLANALRAGYGYTGHKLGLLKAEDMPELVDNPVGGSEWLGQKMQDYGIVSPERHPMAEMAAGFIGPGELASAGKAGMMAVPALVGALKRAGSSADALRAADKVGDVARGVSAATKEAPASKLATMLREDTPKDVPVIEPPVLAPSAVEAPKDVNVGKRFKSGEKAGTYRGTEAFGGINPYQLGQMRAQYLDKMEKGAEGRLWYDQTSKDIFDLVGRDPEKADILANMLATTSSRTPVGSNFMYGAKGWNQALVGDPVRTGGFPNVMGPAIEQVLNDPAARATGLKRSPFSAGLSVEWRGPEFANRPTHDIHDVRAWGINDPKTGEPWSKGVGEAGHRFLDEQAQVVTDRANAAKRGGVEDWTPYRSQAAAWIAQKAAKEGIPIEEAAKHYGNFIGDYSGAVTREWVPGATTGHLQDMLRNDAMKRDYSRSMEEVVRGPGGIDALASKMGALSAPTLENRGIYEGVVSPGYSSQIPVGKGTGTHALDPASERVMRSVASGHGLIGLQDQAAFNFLSGNPSSTKTGGFRFQRGTPFNEQELAQLGERLGPMGVDIPQVDPAGARALYFGDPNSKLAAQLRAVGKEFGADVTPHELSGALIPPEKAAKWSSKPFIEGVEAGGPKMVGGFNEAMKTMGPELLKRTDEFATQHGLQQAPYYKPMMQALSTGGLDALKELVRQGVVPVTVLTALGAYLGAGGAGDQGQL